MSEESPVTFHSGEDALILEAAKEAQKTFKHYWAAISQDFNRIIPAVALSCVKVAFSDDFSDPNSRVEHMWVENINFDGREIHGTLLNSPNWLKSVKQEDEVKFPISRIGDWICQIGDTVYGAYSVQVIRYQMSEEERVGYDEAWGLAFPPPPNVLVPDFNDEFDKVISDLVKEQLEKEPDTVNQDFGDGMTLLHCSALYGRIASVRILLEHGADASRKCDYGWTAADYAKSLGWYEITTFLK